MKDSVIVTLHSSNFAQDFELPSNVPLVELNIRVLKVLQVIYNLFLDSIGIIFEINGAGMLDETATLSDYGIRDGDIIYLAEYAKYGLEDYYS